MKNIQTYVLALHGLGVQSHFLSSDGPLSCILTYVKSIFSWPHRSCKILLPSKLLFLWKIFNTLKPKYLWNKWNQPDQQYFSIAIDFFTLQWYTKLPVIISLAISFYFCFSSSNSGNLETRVSFSSFQNPCKILNVQSHSRASQIGSLESRLGYKVSLRSECSWNQNLGRGKWGRGGEGREEAALLLPLPSPEMQFQLRLQLSPSEILKPQPTLPETSEALMGFHSCCELEWGDWVFVYPSVDKSLDMSYLRWGNSSSKAMLEAESWWEANFPQLGQYVRQS